MDDLDPILSTVPCSTTNEHHITKEMVPMLCWCDPHPSFRNILGSTYSKQHQPTTATVVWSCVMIKFDFSAVAQELC